MKAGRWNESAVQVLRTRIMISGEEFKGRARVDSQCFEGHPSKAGRSPSATATLYLRPNRSITALAPSPIVRSGNWPPLPGASVTVDVGDGQQWWRQFTGRIAEPSGTLLDGSVQVECVDESLRLEVPANQPARSWAATYDPTTIYGRPDLQLATVIEAAAREAGFEYRQGVAWEALAHLPMVGSAHPALGRLLSISYPAGGRVEATRALWSDEDGPTVIGNKFVVIEASPNDQLTPVEITMDLPPRVSGFGWTVATLYGSTDSLGALASPFVAYDHDGDVIRFGTRAGGAANSVRVPSTSSAGTPIARGAARRVTLRFTPGSSSGMNRFEVRTDAGANVNVELTSPGSAITSSWKWRRAEYFGAGPMGAMQVAGRPYPFSQMTTGRSARIRFAQTASLEVSRDTRDDTVRTVLTKAAEAECGAVWVDADGLLQYAGRGVREAQPVAATISTVDGIADWSWSYSIEHRAKKVRLNRLDCATAQPAPLNRLLWASTGVEGLLAGDLWEEVVSAGDDEDWLTVDTSVRVLDANATREDLVGSTAACATFVNTYEESEFLSMFEVSWGLELLGRRAVKWSAKVRDNLEASNQVDLRIPDIASTRFGQYWRNSPMPRLLGTKVRWVDRTSVTTTTSPDGAEEYVHDASWFVQNTAQINDLIAYLRGQVATILPVFRRVLVRPDPRVEVGDRITLRDERRARNYDALIIRKVGDWEPGSASMELIVRVLSSTGPVAPTEPATHWLQNQPSFVRS